MTEKKNKDKVPNYITIQWTGEQPPRIHIPAKWIKQAKGKRFDTFKVSFEIIHRHDENDD